MCKLMPLLIKCEYFNYLLVQIKLQINISLPMNFTEEERTLKTVYENGFEERYYKWQAFMNAISQFFGLMIRGVLLHAVNLAQQQGSSKCKAIVPSVILFVSLKIQVRRVAIE